MTDAQRFISRRETDIKNGGGVRGYVVGYDREKRN